MTRHIIALCGFFFLPFAISPAQAESYESAYTSIAFDECLQLTPPDLVDEYLGAEWVCAGYNGIVAWVSEGDLRMFLGYGPEGREQCSYGQTMSGFNSVSDTLEWRLKVQHGRATPIATILRYDVERHDGGSRQYLVVTKLGEEACHMAYIDASEPDHNESAREAAEYFTEGFDCARDLPFNYTASGRQEGPTPGINYVCTPPE